jgi:integrase/recombinase XerD
MLTLFVRHTKICLQGDGKKPGLGARKLSPEKLRAYRHCDCPKWYTGTHEGKWHQRTSLGTSDWEQAEQKLMLVKAGLPVHPNPIASGSTTIKPSQAVELWLEEGRVNRIAEQTRGQWELIGGRLVEFAQRRKLALLPEIDAVAINQWRSEWQLEKNNRRAGGGIAFTTERLRVGILKLFFKFCRRMKWIKENPMELIRLGKRNPEEAEENATLPLDEEGDRNYQSLIAAIPKYFAGEITKPNGNVYKPRYGMMAHKPDHLLAITELMYETGLRVSDAVHFLVDTVIVDPHDGWGEYTTRQRKTKKLVTVTIPPELLQRIQALPRISPRYVFYDGKTGLNNYYRGQIYLYLRAIGEAVGILNVHPHRLRDSFAVNRLNEGMLIQDVSKLLGHASVAMTERYYAPFVKSRKAALVAKSKRGRASQPDPKVVPIRKQNAG